MEKETNYEKDTEQSDLDNVRTNTLDRDDIEFGDGDTDSEFTGFTKFDYDSYSDMGKDQVDEAPARKPDLGYTDMEDVDWCLLPFMWFAFIEVCRRTSFLFKDLGYAELVIGLEPVFLLKIKHKWPWKSF